MSYLYEIGGYTVIFTPWHSEYMDEDFIAVSVMSDGREVLHAGMTHIEPSAESARKEVEFVTALERRGYESVQQKACHQRGNNVRKPDGGC